MITAYLTVLCHTEVSGTVTANPVSSTLAYWDGRQTSQ